MKRSKLKVGETYYVNSYSNWLDIATEYPAVPYKLLHLGPFHKERYRPINRTRSVIVDGVTYGLPYGYFYDESGAGSPVALFTRQVNGTAFTSLEPLASVRMPYSEYDAKRVVAIAGANFRKAERAAAKDSAQNRIDAIVPDGIEYRVSYGATQEQTAVTFKLGELERMLGGNA